MDPQYSAAFLAKLRSHYFQDVGRRQLLVDVYGALLKHDFDSVHDHLTEDVVLDICGGGLGFDGHWKGRQEVIPIIRRNFSMVSEQKPELEGILESANAIAVMLRETGIANANGQPYAARAVQWFNFRDGKISRIDELIAPVP